MQEQCRFASLSRRQFLGASAAAVPIVSSCSSFARAEAQTISGSAAHHGGDVKTLTKLAAPGLYPGQVVEVRNPAMCNERQPRRRRNQGHA